MEAAPGNKQALTLAHQVTNQFIGIHLMDNRTDRYLHDQVVTGLAGTVLAGTFLTLPRQEFTRMAEIDQRIDTAVGLQVHTATIPTIATVRPAKGDVLLTPETDTAVPAVTGTHFNSGFVYKFHGNTATLVKITVGAPRRRDSVSYRVIAPARRSYN